MRHLVLSAILSILFLVPAFAQIDRERAAQYFREAAALCEKDGGRMWGASLCGPMVFADPKTKEIVTNQPEPAAPRPAILGFANTAINWGDARWTTIVWPMIPAEEGPRGRLMLHELYHRIQPEIGFIVREGNNEHVDTLEGRYWLQLEWRALANALKATGAERSSSIADALGFRAVRRSLFPAAAENEQKFEINEGLAQYTGTAVAFPSREAAVADAIRQIEEAAKAPTYVRTFAYFTGAAYGLLLDEAAPGWTRKIKGTDDLSALLETATGVRPAGDPHERALRYGGRELRAREEKLEDGRQARLAELRRKFTDGPVLRLRAGGNASFLTTGMTAIPGVGMVYPSFRVTADWGKLEAAEVLWSADRGTLILPGPASMEGPVLRGDGWSLVLASGWKAQPGSRKGDYVLVKDNAK